MSTEMCLLSFKPIEEQKYSILSVWDWKIVQLMGEKAALLLEVVYCPQVVDYGLTITSSMRHFNSLARYNGGKHFEVSR